MATRQSPPRDVHLVASLIAERDGPHAAVEWLEGLVPHAWRGGPRDAVLDALGRYRKQAAERDEV